MSRKDSKIELDPIKYEIFYNRLEQALIEAKNTVRYLSSSAITREAGEVAEGVFLLNGESVLLASGMLIHIQTITRAIQYMSENKYAEDIGFYEGDQFINNDAHIGGMHIPDMEVMAPLHYQGKHIGWVGNFTHIPEVGSMDPGGSSPRHTEFCHEGIRLPCIKLIERGNPRRDIWQMMSRSVRDPKGIEIDTRAKVAGNERAKKKIIEIIDEFGLDFYLTAARQLIDDAEIQAREKIKKFKPGIYRSRIYCDSTGPETKLRVIELEMEMTEKGNLILRTPVISPQVKGYNQCALPGFEGLVFSVLLSQLFYDLRWNSGTARGVKLDIPRGSMMNVKEDAALSYCPVGIGMQMMGNVNDCLSRAAYIAGQYQVIFASCGIVNGITYFSLDRFGRIRVGILADCLCIGGGARYDRDGLDSSVTQWNPWSECGDLESFEMVAPILYLGRRHLLDSGGFGKFRGGSAGEVLLTPRNTPMFVPGVQGSGGYVAGTQGLYGAYPAAPTKLVIVHETDLFKRADKQKPIPHGVEEIGGYIKGKSEHLPPWSPSHPMKEGDLIGLTLWGGGGLGDPLEREPELIVRDIENRVTTLKAAREIYSCAIDPDTLEIDHEKTEQMRDARRKERLSQGIPARKYIKQMVEYSPGFVKELEFEEKLEETEEKIEKVVVKKDIMNLTPYVKVIETDEGRRLALCSRCGHCYCDGSENFKLSCLIFDRDPKEIHPGDQKITKDWMIYREFYCAGCGTQVEVEATPPGTPILNNIDLNQLREGDKRGMNQKENSIYHL